MLEKCQIIYPSYNINQSLLYSRDVASYSSETQNKNNQGKSRGLLTSGHGLSTHPYLKQPYIALLLLVLAGMVLLLINDSIIIFNNITS
jgi:hypothetical protein